ncbi:secreted protein [Colletotrichum musicola]|uniref:Secreted protein n=3 Tax=Colletotrichum orchidearum species complex TaxID=2707337 RepID=A0A8H6KYP1_9PEZI|nr:secreted protein [Colletotrichum sojae]KAF6833108.1 secreted protein [Colletotrichum plurivorum]KAF6839661.1 secreted protein [Colletotrichum musicola]
MKNLFAILLPVLAAASPLGPTGISDTPDPKEIQIVNASFSGSGCPQGSVSTIISPDRTVITFGFDRFQTYIGPGLPLAERTKNCALHLSLKYPGGFQFAVVESTYHGYAQLDEGVTGTFYSTYFFSQDASSTTTTQTSIAGGGIWLDGQVYTKQDSIPTASLIWAPCGATGILNVNNRIALTTRNPQAYGSITDDDATVAFTQQINVKWQACRK